MNFPTFVVLALVIAVFVLIVRKEIKNKKNGISSCSCAGGCNSCNGHCHDH